MNKQLNKLITHLDLLFLKHIDALGIKDFIELKHLEKGELPKEGGIYVLYDKEEKPIYLGRTKNIRQRIQLHIRDSSKEESATFAFNLTKKHFEESKNKDILYNAKRKRTRKDLINDKEFLSVFNKKKELVKSMKLKYILVENDVIQTIFEPYLAVKLGTYNKYNSFETH